MLTQCLSGLGRALLLAGLLMTGLSAQAEDPKVLYAVKLPPIKTLSKQLMGFMREVEPGPKTEMYPMMLLGPLGYPEFKGVSETAPVTVYFFQPAKGEESPPFVILAKMDTDAPMRRALTMKPKSNSTNPMANLFTPGFSVQEADGWTLFAREKYQFAYAEDVAGLIKLSEGISGFDITARAFVGPEMMAEWARQLKAAVIDHHVRMGKDASDPQVLHWSQLIEFLAKIGENFEWAQAGLDIRPTYLATGIAARAIEGTPESELISTPVGGPAPVGKLLSAASISYLMSVDTEAGRQYTSVLAERALAIFPEEFAPYIKQWQGYADEFSSKWGNNAAVSVDFVDLGVAKTTIVMPTKMDYQSYNEMMHFNFDEFFPFLVQYFLLEDSAESILSMAIKDAVAKAGGQPVDAMEIVTEQMKFNWDDPAAGVEKVLTTDTTYYVIADGAYVSSASLETLEAVVQRLAEQTDAPNNIAGKIQLKDGQMLGLTMDLRKMIQLLVGKYNPESEVAKQALRKLTNTKLEPVTASIEFDDNQFVYAWKAPVSALKAIREAMRTIEQAEMEMNYGHDQAQPEASESAE